MLLLLDFLTFNISLIFIQRSLVNILFLILKLSLFTIYLPKWGNDLEDFENGRRAALLWAAGKCFPFL